MTINELLWILAENTILGIVEISIIPPPTRYIALEKTTRYTKVFRDLLIERHNIHIEDDKIFIESAEHQQPANRKLLDVELKEGYWVCTVFFGRYVLKWFESKEDAYRFFMKIKNDQDSKSGKIYIDTWKHWVVPNPRILFRR